MARPKRVVGDGKFSSGKGRQSLDEFRKEYLRFRNSTKNKSNRGEFQGGSFQRYKDQPGERPMATERIPETPVRDIKPDLMNRPYLMGPRGKVPEGLPVEQGQTLSGYHDSRPIPESNAEGIGRAENDMGKEATRPNQMDRTDPGRPGGTYGAKPKQRNQMDQTDEGRPGGTYGGRPSVVRKGFETVQARNPNLMSKPKTSREEQKRKETFNRSVNGTKTTKLDEIRKAFRKG